MIRLFVGYDADEALAYSVFSFSVQRRASQPVAITPVMRTQLRGVFDRPRGPMESTDFSMSRFMVPHLCDYRGWAIFADGDMLCRADINELWKLRDNRYAVQVVKHDHHDTNPTKFLGKQQTNYAKKNWSSVMLLNNEKCKSLTPAYVNSASGLELHQFHWLDGNEIGELPYEWNHLVRAKPLCSEAKIVHYTLGMPFFHGYNECEFAGEWRDERQAMMSYRSLAHETQIPSR